MRRQRGAQALGRRRLVEVGEGAARQPLLAVLVHAQDLHRDVARLERALELAEHVPAQHVGQEDVERHGDRLVLQREVERLRAARRDQRLEAGGVRGIDQDAGVVGIVLDDQQGTARPAGCCGGRRGTGRRGARAAATCGSGAAARQRLAQRRARAGVHGRQEEREGAADARRAAQGAARRPAACASSRLMARPRPVPPYLRLVLASACWKASNTIFCFSTGMPTPVSVTSKATTELAWLSAMLSERQPVCAGSDAQPHAALGGELQRVGQQVLQDLLQALGIGDDAAAEVGVDLDVERQALRFGLVAERPRHRLEHVGEEDLLGIDGDRARFDLGEVEDVADQVQQVGAGAVDGAGELDLLGREVALGVVGELLAQDQDRVERRAQLVAHVGQELRLVARGQRQLGGLLLDRAAGLLDLLVLALDLGVALGELRAPSARAARWSAAARPAGSAARRRASATARAGPRSAWWLRSSSARCRSRR